MAAFLSYCSLLHHNVQNLQLIQCNMNSFLALSTGCLADLKLAIGRRAHCKLILELVLTPRYRVLLVSVTLENAYWQCHPQASIDAVQGVIVVQTAFPHGPTNLPLTI